MWITWTWLPQETVSAPRLLISERERETGLFSGKDTGVKSTHSLRSLMTLIVLNCIGLHCNAFVCTALDGTALLDCIFVSYRLALYYIIWYYIVGFSETTTIKTTVGSTYPVTVLAELMIPLQQWAIPVIVISIVLLVITVVLLLIVCRGRFKKTLLT